MSLVADLRGALGEHNVLDEPVELHIYSKDASLIRGEANVVVFPQTTADVVEVIEIAASHRTPIVARGAGTGLTAGASPTEGGIVLSMTAMDHIDIDPDNRTAWVGPGAINLDLTKAASAHGLHFAPDPSSQPACTIGGNIATNAGGPHCLAEGSTTSHVLGLEVVLADGDVITVGGPAPDVPGLDLRGLLVGSEGTLGVVTGALVRLLPIEPDTRTLLMDFPTVEGAAATVSEIIAAGMVPAALEIMDQRRIEAVENWLQAGLPVEAAAILLAEVVGETESVDAEAAEISRIAKASGANQVEIAETEEHRDLLWKGRKSAFGAVAQLAPDYYLHDAVVPRTKLVETLRGVYDIADRYDLALFNASHAGDGNLHPLIAFDSNEPGVYEKVHRAGDEIVTLCLENGGALSGEHGIGVEKRDLMRASFTEFDLDAQARLKEVFDPEGLLNPGKILPSGSRRFDLGGEGRDMSDGVWV